MLSPRIIPCLLVHNKGLVKTERFKKPKYIGDPLNAVKIFNEKKVDEIIVIDIDATVEGREPNYDMIKNLATECRMPLCYGGGIKTTEQAKMILSLGVEKIALSSAALEDFSLISAIAREAGSQSVVVVLDVRKKLFGGYDIYTHNGSKKIKANIENVISSLQNHGAGEVVLNSIDNDGMMDGYDYDLVNKVKPLIEVPLTILGGAGKNEDIGLLFEQHGLIGAAAGSLFVFKGKYKAVLINYPLEKEKGKILSRIKKSRT